MSETTGDLLPEEKDTTLSSGLNVLTILTIIACVLQALIAIWNFTRAQQVYDTREEVVEKMNSGATPALLKSLMGKPEDFLTLVTKSNENKIPILAVSLIAVALCLGGALQMRKLKKQGYIMYVIGEVLPFISGVLFIGAFTITSTFAFIGMAIALLFILLYTFQRKNLIY
jgi:hypothetical protein